MLVEQCTDIAQATLYFGAVVDRTSRADYFSWHLLKVVFEIETVAEQTTRKDSES